MKTNSKIQTRKLAAKIAKRILKQKPRKSGATIIALHGDLGAGKTTFTQGFIKAFGVTHHVTSPTFLIVRRYEILPKKIQNQKSKAQSYKNIYHFDLYRIHHSKELLDLGFKKIISNSQNIILIEWPERIGSLIPESAERIYFGHGKHIDQRLIRLGTKKSGLLK